MAEDNNTQSEPDFNFADIIEDGESWFGNQGESEPTPNADAPIPPEDSSDDTANSEEGGEKNDNNQGDGDSVSADSKEPQEEESSQQDDANPNLLETLTSDADFVNIVGEIKDIDGLKEAVRTQYQKLQQAESVLKETSSFVAQSEFEKRLIQASRNGEDAVKLLRTKTTDYDSVPDLDIIKMSFFEDNKYASLTPDEREIVFKAYVERNYGFDLDEDAIRLQMKVDANQVRGTLKEEQQKLDNPSQDPAIREAWLNNVSEAIKDFKAIELEGMGEKVSVPVNQQDIKDALENPYVFFDNLLSSFVDKDGKVDFNGLKTTIAFMQNKDAVLNNIVAQYKKELEDVKKLAEKNGEAKGTEKILEEIKNPSQANKTSSDTSRIKSETQQMLEQMYRD